MLFLHISHWLAGEVPDQRMTFIGYGRQSSQVLGGYYKHDITGWSENGSFTIAAGQFCSSPSHYDMVPGRLFKLLIIYLSSVGGCGPI